MANASILAAFERMWQHVTSALSNKSDVDHTHDNKYADINAVITEETDPTVPAWAKTESKPSYTAAEVGAAPASHGHSYNDLSDKPTPPTIPSSLPANGGNADTVDNKHASDFAEAGHTHDTSTLINTLTEGTSAPTDADYYISQYSAGGTTTTSYHRRPHSALWSYIQGKISSVLGLTSSSYGGNSASATKLTTSKGSATQPVYFSDGKPVATTYTLGASVPSGAKFTDTVYTHPSTHAASVVTSGTFAATDVKAKSGTDYSTARVRNISAGTSDMTAGSSALASGDIYFVYE